MRHLILLALLVLAYFSANYMYANVVKPMWQEGVIPGQEYEYEAIAGFYLVTIPSIVAVSLSLPLGVLADKLGKGRMLLLTGLLMGLGLIVVASSPNLIGLSLGFALFAVGMQGIYPAIMGSIADTVPEAKRGIGYASYYASSVLGNIVGLLIGLVVYWRTGYIMLGLLTVIFTIVLWTMLTRIYRSLQTPSTPGTQWGRGATRAATTKAVVLMYIMIFFWGMPWGAISRYSVNFIQDAWGVSRTTATLVIILASVSIVVGHILGGTLADRRVSKGDLLGRVKVSIVGVVLGMLVMLAFIQYPYPRGEEKLVSLIPPVVLAVGGMMFTTFAYPNISSVLSEVVKPEYRGTVFAVFNILNNLGWGIGPTLYGALKAYLVETMGFSIAEASRYSITSIVLLWIIPLAIWLLMIKEYPRHRVSGR